MIFLIVITIFLLGWVGLSFFLDFEQGAVTALVITFIFLPIMTFIALASGTNWGREMELCDQAGGVYSLWTNECTTPTEVIELETGDE